MVSRRERPERRGKINNRFRERKQFLPPQPSPCYKHPHLTSSSLIHGAATDPPVNCRPRRSRPATADAPLRFSHNPGISGTIATPPTSALPTALEHDGRQILLLRGLVAHHEDHALSDLPHGGVRSVRRGVGGLGRVLGAALLAHPQHRD